MLAPKRARSRVISATRGPYTELLSARRGTDAMRIAETASHVATIRATRETAGAKRCALPRPSACAYTLQPLPPTTAATTSEPSVTSASLTRTDSMTAPPSVQLEPIVVDPS
jgi:hypothetical protein